MSQVGRELEGEQCVIELEVLTDVHTDGRVFGQDVQAVGLFRDAQFAGRAQHALALDPTQLAQLDLEDLAIGTRWQLGAHGGARDLDAGAHIGRATHDLQDFARTRIHLAHVQTVGIRVLGDFQHLRHHHTGEGRCHRLQLFHFQTGHRQQVSQLLGAQVGVAETAQPGLGELHVRDPWVSVFSEPCGDRTCSQACSKSASSTTR